MVGKPMGAQTQDPKLDEPNLVVLYLFLASFFVAPSATIPVTTASSLSETAMSPPTAVDSIPTSMESFFDRPSDRRFRHSTMIAAAASASLASSRRTAKQTVSVGTNPSLNNSPTYTRPVIPTTTEMDPVFCRSLSESDATLDERPKIRITIPRDILLACPPSSSASINANNTTGSSSGGSRETSLVQSNSSFEEHSLSDTGMTDVNDQTAINVPARFLAPVELPRRSVPNVNSSPPLCFTGLRTSEPMIVPDHPHSSEHISPSTTPGCRSPTKWTARVKENTPPSKTLGFPKVLLFNANESSSSHVPPHYHQHHKRRPSDEAITILRDGRTDTDQTTHVRSTHVGESLLGKRKKHSDRKEKRRRKHIQEIAPAFVSDPDSASSFDISPTGYPGPTKVRRRSGSSNSHASTLSSSDVTKRPGLLRFGFNSDRFQLRFPEPEQIDSPSPSPKNAFTPPPSATNVTHANRLRDRSNRCVAPQPRVTLLTPDPKRLRLVQEICVTDVTVDGLTISIKECSGPDDFFGVPSSQLVQWSGSKLHHPVVYPNAPSSPVVCSASSATSVVTCSTAIKSECQKDTSMDDRLYTDENVAPEEPIVSSQKSRAVCDLSTIYEESTLESSSSKRSENAILSDPVNEVGSKIADLVDAPIIPPLEDDVKSPVSVSKSEAPSTSALMLAATEAAIKSSEEPPSSPGLLTPPRRSSTPVDQSPRSVTNDNVIVSNNVDPASISVSVSKSALSSVPTTTTVISTSSTVVTNNTVVRPTSTSPNKITVFSHPGITKSSTSTGRSKSTGPKAPGSSRCNAPTSDTPRRAKVRDSSANAVLTNLKVPRTSTKSISCSTSRSSSSAALDPNNVYTFSDSSPTHHLSPRTLSIPRLGGANSNVSRRSVTASSKPETSVTMDQMETSLSSSMFTCAGGNSFSPLLGLSGAGPQSLNCLSVPGTPVSLALQMPPLSGSAPMVSTHDSALATAIYFQQLRMQLLGTDAASSSHLGSNMPPVSSCMSSINPWATQIPLSNNLTAALGSFMPNTSNFLTGNSVNNETLFTSNFSPFTLSTGSSMQPPTSVSSVSTSSTLIPTGPPGPNLMLPAQLQLADMVAAAVSQSAVFNTSSSRELYPSTEHLCGAISAIPSSSSMPFMTDESPMDLSAKR
ncbi:unnamed protein product [Echinostoma caproni]|uniref:Protein kinase domain-containing protein n=1 Tax=Echinostoma caproni TaxID=27848 RepID=A0A183A8R2_9TREM|nr:unnamed protein product [Echinostoma caproni]